MVGPSDQSPEQLGCDCVRLQPIVIYSAFGIAVKCVSILPETVDPSVAPTALWRQQSATAATRHGSVCAALTSAQRAPPSVGRAPAIEVWLHHMGVQFGMLGGSRAECMSGPSTLSTGFAKATRRDDKQSNMRSTAIGGQCVGCHAEPSSLHVRHPASKLFFFELTHLGCSRVTSKPSARSATVLKMAL